jgi:hypothetical protein
VARVSDIGIHAGGLPESTFNPATMLLITAVGALAFIAMLVLGAYAPDLRSGHNGGSHALSNAATGFSGLVQLADATGRHPTIVRSVADLKNEDLTVITPDDGGDNLSNILTTRGPRTTLVVLPKWWTITDKGHAGWVQVIGLTFSTDPEGVLAPDTKLKIARSKGHGEPLVNVGSAIPAGVHFLAPAVVQTMSGQYLQPLITTPAGGIVLGRVGTRNLYVLSEPDLINNHGMGDERQAKAALALLDYLNSTGADGVLFDVTANGLGRSRSPLKLAFDPPFLAVTLTIFAAMLLAAWQALVRFGPVRRRERAIAFGKAALVDNSAALIRKAGREAHLGSRYVEVIRERAVSLFRLPPTVDGETLTARLEALNPRRSFAATAAAASNARTRDELLDAAQSLNHWLEEVQG